MRTREEFRYPDSARRPFGEGVVAAGAIAVAIGLGLLLVREAWAAVVVTLGLIGIAVARVGRPLPPSARPFRWIPWAWLVLFLVSVHNFGPGRSPLDASTGSLSSDNLIELGAYGAIGALTLATLYSRRGAHPMPVWPFFVWPLVALASTFWSIIPGFTFVRALQIFVPMTLGLLHARIWRRAREAGEQLWRSTLRLYVQIVTGLVVFGFVVHDWPGGRFVWPGVEHPITASSIVGIGLLALLVGGRQLIGSSRWMYLARIPLFGTALYYGQSRSVLFSAALAILVSMWVAGRHHPLARYAAIPYYVGSIALLTVFARSALFDYVTRGESPTSLSSLNGRVDLWRLALRHISDWVQGTGYGSARVTLFRRVHWAGQAHSAWLELLLGIGIAGLAIAIITVLYLAFRLARRHDRDRPALYRLSVGLFVFLIVFSTVEAGFTIPGVSLTLFAFLLAAAVGRPLRTTEGSALGNGARKVGSSLQRRPMDHLPVAWQ
jgi:O-antigen ligase/polysaccharide polymerase Wzy-like membrane protein